MVESGAISDRFGLGQVDQVSYAVRDLDQAVVRYGALFGPFRTASVELDDLVYRGRKSRAALNIAFGNTGPLEIELVQLVSGEFPQGEFLARHGEGLHHIRFVVDDLAAKMALMRPEGFGEVVVGHSGPVSFAYLEAPDFLGDSMIELLQRG